MSLLDNNQMQTIRTYIYQNTRLLERRLFEYFFGEGKKEECLTALLAYQNADGGFGNGIEPDVLCPTSTAIGAETALFILDLLETPDKKILDSLVLWINANQNTNGIIPHPIEKIKAFPHQSWWENADDERILALTGFLCKLGTSPGELLNKTRNYFSQVDMPKADNYYGYPYFIFLKYCGNTPSDHEKLDTMTSHLRVILEKYEDHFPLFSRAWYHAVELLDTEIVKKEAEKFINAIQEDGGLNAPYPQLPYWRPIWTLDGLILLKRFGFL